ncbi:MAG: DUF1425 domain-containing protein [Planctomycetota bacterium]
MLASLLCSSALVLGFGACVLTPSGSQNSYQTSKGKLEVERIEGNKLLANNLQILNPIEKTVDGRKIAQFEIKNKLSNTQRFAWAVDWFDEDGFRINDNQRVFEPVSLGGFGSTFKTITAPKTGNLSWRLTVTSPDEVH